MMFESPLGDGSFLAKKIQPKKNRPQMAKMFRGKRLGIGFVDEVSIDPQGQLTYLRRHNGDQDHQGRHARISVGDWKILHIKLYEY